MANLLEEDTKGRWSFTRGKREGEFLDDVADSRHGRDYLRWLLENSPSSLNEDATLAVEEALEGYGDE